jgi:hypothetical protein
VVTNWQEFGVPYGSRTRVAAVKERRPIVIQWNFSGMDSTLRNLKDSPGTDIGLLMDARNVAVGFLLALIYSFGRELVTFNCLDLL